MQSETKSDYIRKHLNLRPQQVIEHAKRDGITVSKQLVYSVQHTARKKLQRPTSSARRTPATSSSSSSERLFAELACELGLTKASQLLAGVRTLALSHV
jgi:phage terminase small subunit